MFSFYFEVSQKLNQEIQSISQLKELGNNNIFTVYNNDRNNSNNNYYATCCVSPQTDLS